MMEEVEEIQMSKLEIVEDNNKNYKKFKDKSNKMDNILKRVVKRKIKNRCGIQLQTMVVKPEDPRRGKKVMLLAAPLGLCDLSVYLPLMIHFGDEFTYIGWNYRGMFESEMPKRNRRISIRDHAEDAYDVMDQLGFNYAEVMVGHSMGVQVTLEFTLLYPEKVHSLILCNGAHGSVFSTAFQPGLKLPFVENVSKKLVETILNNNPQWIVSNLKSFTEWGPMSSVLKTWAKYYGSQNVLENCGDDWINKFFSIYLGGICKDKTSSDNYLRSFQELNAHSVHHLLDTIEHPTLLVAGMFDYVTPAYHMKEMSKKMKNTTYVCDIWSTHATLLENPDIVVREAEIFLSEQSRFERTNSTCFTRALLDTAEN